MTDSIDRYATHQPPTSRKEWVAERLRADIHAGNFAPGAKLLTRELISRYSTSATPVREALSHLSNEGLVMVLPQQGARVAALRLEEAVEIYELRLMLEPLAIRRSISRAPHHRFQELDEAYERLEGAEANINNHYFDVHNEFHRLMRKDSDSRWLLRIVDQLATNSERYRRLRTVSEEVHVEHYELLKSCREGDANAAADQMRSHIANTLETIREKLTTQE